MKRTPKKGEPYQLCIHLAAEPNRNDRHYWHVSSRDCWIVLCDECHAAFSQRRSVDVHGVSFSFPADAPNEPDSSSFHHSAPPDTVLVDKPPVEKRESPPPPEPPKAPEPSKAPEATKAPAAERLTFRPKEKAADYLPLIDRGLSVLSELARAHQAQAKARADADLRRMELEAQATERILRLLDACTAAAERLTALAIEQDAVIVASYRQIRDEWIDWADPGPAQPAEVPRTSQRKPRRRV